VEPSRLFELTRFVVAAQWEQARPLLPATADDARALMTWLRRQHLVGQFAASMDTGPLCEWLPASFVAEARRWRARQAERNLKVLAVSHRAVTMLDGCGIPSLLLKGVHYAERFCGGLDRRFLWDVDLLVPTPLREAAVACALQGGWCTETGRLWNNQLTRRLSHAVALNGDEGVELDLHWKLRHRPDYRIDEDALWRDAQRFEIRGYRFTVPGDSHCLLTLLLGIAHDLEAGRLKVKALFDLHAMLSALDQVMDWDVFFAAREREGLERIMVGVLRLFDALFEPIAELPMLDQALARRHSDVDAIDRRTAEQLVCARRQRLGNRLWYADLYPGGVGRYLAWWLGTAPLRFALGRTV
jgi:hypothetical protein